MYQSNVNAYLAVWNGAKNARTPFILTIALVACLFLPSLAAAESFSILFLGGENGRHQPSLRAQQLIPVMETRGINITYTENLGDLDSATLAKYHGLIVYADQVKINPAQEKALLDYVASGKGFIAIHCAVSFLDSPKYIELIGAQFKSHSTGKFCTRVVNADHPITKGVREFEAWDETYVHTKLNQDCKVLQVRREGDRDEPWTWVRNDGKGRVFYTAYGHDQRTWGDPEFQSLIERGIRWACGSNSVVNNAQKTLE